jgi:hypothetical protein
MTREADSQTKAPGWAEHTVVANLPRRFPSVSATHAPLAEVEEPRTVVGEAPSPASAQQLLARYAALAQTRQETAHAEPKEATNDAAEPPLTLPLRQPWFVRVAEFAQDDFQRAPRIVRLLLPALPLVAAATTFLDVDPAAPAFSRPVAAATSAAAPAPAPPSVGPAVPALLPRAPVTIAKHPGRTLAAEAADAAARGDRAQAIAAYTELAAEHPDDVVYASAARILTRLQERDRPHPRQ